jgi:hypothetical protein
VMVPVEVPVFHNVPVDVLASVTGSELSDAQVWNWAHLKRAVAVVSSGLGLKRPRARQSECCRASTQTAAAFLDAQGWSVEGIGAALELAPVDVPGELAAGKRRLLESSADDSDEVYEASKCAFRAPELELWADVVRACSEQRANIVPSTVRDFLEVEEVLEKARKASEVHDPLDPDPRAVVVSFLAVNGFRAGELEMLLALSDEVIKALKIEGAELLAEILFAFPQDGGAPLQLMEMFAAAPGAVELELALALETTAPETDAEGTVTLSRSPHVANALILLGWDPTPFVERSALAELNELAANALDERGSMIWRKRTRELASLDLLALELGLPGGGAGNVSWIEAELRKVLAQVARALLQRRLEEFVRHRNCNPQLAASREHLGCLVVRDGVRPAFYERALKRLDGRRRRVIEKHTRLFHDPVPFARWLDLRFLISTARDRLSQRAGREVGPMEVFAERCGPTGDPERCRSFARIAARRGLSEATVVERYVTALAHLALSLTDHDPHGLGDRIP